MYDEESADWVPSQKLGRVETVAPPNKEISQRNEGVADHVQLGDTDIGVRDSSTQGAVCVIYFLATVMIITLIVLDPQVSEPHGQSGLPDDPTCLLLDSHLSQAGQHNNTKEAKESSLPGTAGFPSVEIASNSKKHIRMKKMLAHIISKFMI